MNARPKRIAYIEQFFRLNPGELLSRDISSLNKNKALRVLVWYYRTQLRLSIKEVELITGLTPSKICSAVSYTQKLATKNIRIKTLTQNLWTY